MKKATYLVALIVTLVFMGCDWFDSAEKKEAKKSLAACKRMVKSGIRRIPDDRAKRFLGKVQEDTALCRGGEKTAKYRDTPWLDWANYFATGDSSTKSPGLIKDTGHLSPDGRGVDGALLDLEYERIELIKFNLFENNTYEEYIKGRDGVEGSALKVWNAMRLPKDHPNYQDVGGDGDQLCKGELIRHRTVTGICIHGHGADQVDLDRLAGLALSLDLFDSGESELDLGVLCGIDPGRGKHVLILHRVAGVERLPLYGEPALGLGELAGLEIEMADDRRGRASTPRQNVTWSRIFSAAGFGSG